MLFSGIYARMFRAFREELKKLYELNRLFLESSPQWLALTEGPSAILSPSDYQDNQFRIFPSADASTASGQQRKDKATMLMQVSSSAPGFNRYEVTKEFLEAFEYANIEKIFPDPKGPNALPPPPPDPKVMAEQAKLQQADKHHQDDMQLDVVRLKSDIALNEGKIAELQAKAQRELADAQGVGTGHQIAIIEAHEGLMSALNVLQKHHAASMDHNLKQQQMKQQPKGAISGNNSVGP